MRRLLPLVLLLTACANSGTPMPAYNPALVAGYAEVEITETARAAATRLAGSLITESAHEKEFWFAVTQSALPPALTSTGQAIASTDIALTRAWSDAQATAVVRTTESARSAIAIPTSAAATGTALAVYAETDKARLESARSANNLIGLFALGFIAGLGIGLYWLIGLARADVKRRNNLAEARPEVVGGVLVLPPGYSQHPIVMAARALPAPAEIEERTIGGQANGKPRFIEVSQPVNEHEARWREALQETLFLARDNGTFASTDLCGAGKPFSSADHWKRVTDVLKDNDLILKDNGGQTVRAGEWDVIIKRVQDATRPLKLPERLPPRLRLAQNML